MKGTTAQQPSSSAHAHRTHPPVRYTTLLFLFPPSVVLFPLSVCFSGNTLPSTYPLASTGPGSPISDSILDLVQTFTFLADRHHNVLPVLGAWADNVTA